MDDDRHVSTQLGRLVREVRLRHGWSLADVQRRLKERHQVETTRQWISAVERDTAVPSVEIVVALWDALHEGHGDPEDLARWILLWSGRKTTKTTVRDLTTAALRAVEDCHGTTRAAGLSARGLAGFPKDLLPLTVIVGDRRRPLTDRSDVGDLFAGSPSNSDLTYLSGLRLPPGVEIHPDRPWVWRTDERLAELYGDQNLLVIGSPATNFATRALNHLAIFPFIVDHTWSHWWRHEFLPRRSILGDPDVFARFAELLLIRPRRDDGSALLPDKDDKAVVALVRAMPIKNTEAWCKKFNGPFDAAQAQPHIEFLAQRFRASGFYDPLDGAQHGSRTRQRHDFATITVAPNPYSTSGHVAVLVGGLSQAGTTQAIRMLGQRSNFDQRPFGGVLEVRIDQFDDELGRIQRAEASWETSSYSFADLDKAAVDDTPPWPNLDGSEIDGSAIDGEAIRRVVGLIVDEA